MSTFEDKAARVFTKRGQAIAEFAKWVDTSELGEALAKGLEADGRQVNFDSLKEAYQVMLEMYSR